MIQDEMLFDVPAQLECCPFLKTAPRSRPAAKQINNSNHLTVKAFEFTHKLTKR